VKVVAGILYCLAIVLVVVGFRTMYTYGNGEFWVYGGMSGHVVGSDEANLIIIGIRGLGYIGAGVLAGVMGAAASISGAITEAKASKDQAEATPTRTETA
jgi:hypothetical protein